MLNWPIQLQLSDDNGCFESAIADSINLPRQTFGGDANLITERIMYEIDEKGKFALDLGAYPFVALLRCGNPSGNLHTV